MYIVWSINYRVHVCMEITTTRGSTLLYGVSMHTVQSIWLLKIGHVTEISYVV